MSMTLTDEEKIEESYKMLIELHMMIQNYMPRRLYGSSHKWCDYESVLAIIEDLKYQTKLIQAVLKPFKK